MGTVTKVPMNMLSVLSFKLTLVVVAAAAASLNKPFMKRKTGGEHLKELSEWKDGDFAPEEIFFDTTKAGIQTEYQGLASINDFIKNFSV
jgi:hypothetical protein